MRNFAFLLTLPILLLSACKSGNPDKALARWNRSPIPDYYYLRLDSQPLLGISRLTGVIVRGGEVDRVFGKALSRNPAGEQVILGTFYSRTPYRDDGRINPAYSLTMPRLLEECRQAFAGAANGKRSFKAGSQGELKTCTARPPGCQDNCGRSIEVIEFQSGTLSDEEIKNYLQNTRTFLKEG